MNLEKLKDSARKFEQKEDWRRAIEVYLKAIQQIESGNEPAPDLSLYNRVGDLYLKINDTAAAVRSYERAVDLYRRSGFLQQRHRALRQDSSGQPRPDSDLPQARPSARPQERRHRSQAEPDRVPRADERAGPARPGLPVGEGLRRPVLRQPGNPADAGRAAPRLVTRGRGAGAAGEAGRRSGGAGRFDRRPKDAGPDHRIETGDTTKPTAKPKAGPDLVFLDVGLDSQAPGGRAPRKTVPASRKTPQPLTPAVPRARGPPGLGAGGGAGNGGHGWGEPRR